MQAVPRHRLAHLRRLAQHPSERRKAGQFLIEGAVLVSDALDAGLRVSEVLLERGRAGEAEIATAERARSTGAMCTEVPDGILTRIGASVTPPPLLVVAEIPTNSRRETDLLAKKTEAGEGYSLVAVEVADPSNAGALLRCAEGAGVSEVIFAGNCVDTWGPKAVRASAGSVFRLPPRWKPDIAAFSRGLRETGRQVVATASDRGKLYYEFNYENDAVILLGNETHGLPETIEGCITDWVHIPLSGGTESLNVAMAAAVICFEARRQAGMAETAGTSR